MVSKTEIHQFQGLQQDKGYIAQGAEFLRDAYNIRITPRDNSVNRQKHSGVIVTNERGPVESTLHLDGIYMGHAVLNKYVVIFTHDIIESQGSYIPNDHIYRVDSMQFDIQKNGYTKDEIVYKELYHGDLGFNPEYPIEALADYETEYIQKVYWTDNLNPPRVINIAPTASYKEDFKEQFDFVPPLQLNEEVTVEKQFNTAGEFDPGVIQYAFTYYNEFLQETSIFYTTPLYYTSHLDRGGRPTEKVSNSFKITVTNPDTNFDYLRIYSIQRTAINDTPYVKRVQDIDLRKMKQIKQIGTPSDKVDKEAVLQDYWQDEDSSEFDYRALQVEPDVYYGDGNTWKVFSGAREHYFQVTNDGVDSLYCKGQYMSSFKEGILLKVTIDNTDYFIIPEKCNILINARQLYKLDIVNGNFVPQLQSELLTDKYYLILSDGVTNKTIIITDIHERNKIRRIEDNYKDSTGKEYRIDPDDPFGGGVTPTPTPDPDPDPDPEPGHEPITIQYSVITNRINFDVYIQSFQYINQVSVIDTGLIGEAVDPKELLFLGGNQITAKTLTQKDGTLFLGNLTTKSQYPIHNNEIILGYNIDNPFYSPSNIQSCNDDTGITEGTFTKSLRNISEGAYSYWTSLDQYTAGFKTNEWYRFGIQLQDNTGKWSPPIWIGDAKQTLNPAFSKITEKLNIPGFKYILTSGQVQLLKQNTDFVKIRPLVVFPTASDRNVVVQGLACPTLYTTKRRTEGDLYAQSSWFIRSFSLKEGRSLVYDVNRPWDGYDGSGTGPEADTFGQNGYLGLIDGGGQGINTSPIRNVEIQGYFNSVDQFRIDKHLITVHSPEFVFDEDLQYIDYKSLRISERGGVTFKSLIKDIDIICKSAPADTKGLGFIHKSFINTSNNNIVLPDDDEELGYAGLFYDDFIVTDDVANSPGDKLPYYPWDVAISVDKAWNMSSPVKWLVYPWHRNGSLNNDSERLGKDTGARSSELETKRYSSMYVGDSGFVNRTSQQIVDAQMFTSDQMEIIKVDGNIYQGNVDTLLASAELSGFYFAYNNSDLFIKTEVETPFDAVIKGHIFKVRDDIVWGEENNHTAVADVSVIRFNGSTANKDGHDKVGMTDRALAMIRPNIRMKYRSTPHLVVKLDGNTSFDSQNYYPIVEMHRYWSENEMFRQNTMFGGVSHDALLQNIWLPAGEPVRIDSLNDNGDTIFITRGDTWYQRYDCLKTYAFTPQDINQIVEIASFMVESKINLDGRYDRNRGQVNNTQVNPTNFNLLNTVYSQLDNFFSYQLLNDQFYTYNRFNNQITWSTEKTAGMQTDPWTKVTLAAVHNFDGDKGAITELLTNQSNLYCFQEKGISLVSFNARVQVEASDGVPIEISNNYKMEGKTYLMENMGTSNRKGICNTSDGVYFIDEVSKELYMLSQNKINPVSDPLFMTRWFTGQLTGEKTISNNTKPQLLHDAFNNDLYTTGLSLDYSPDIYQNDDTLYKDSTIALCYSQIMQQFTSFMSYGNLFGMFNLDNECFGIETYYEAGSSGRCRIYRMFKGMYNYFPNGESGFDYKPFYIEFVSNENPTVIKSFSNIEMYGSKWVLDQQGTMLEKLSTTDLFDHVRVWHEYQDTGKVALQLRTPYPSNLKNKQGIWRIDIPRDRKNNQGNTYGLNRIQNLWTDIRLSTENSLDRNEKIELYTVSVIYNADVGTQTQQQ